MKYFIEKRAADFRNSSFFLGIGEGYSTIEMLADLKPQYMKLDMQFVQGVAEDLEKQQTARKFLEKSLEVGSIPLAEGVETREDFEWLKELGYQLFRDIILGNQQRIHWNVQSKIEGSLRPKVLNGLSICFKDEE